jgi:hypothetical protein
MQVNNMRRGGILQVCEMRKILSDAKPLHFCFDCPLLQNHSILAGRGNEYEHDT